MKKEKVYELKIEDEDEMSGIDSISLVDEPAIMVNWIAFKKEMKDDGDPCWEGYEQIGTKMLNGREVPNCVPIKKENMESYSDYPESIKNNAKSVLKWVDENGWGSCGTDVGKQRANQLASGEPISLDTVKRMYSYLSRHAGDLDSSKGYAYGCGKLMYDSWGGKSALSWSESKVKSFAKEEFEKGVPHYTKDGVEYTGPTHKNADGRLMTGAEHTEDSEYLYHEDELGYDVITLPPYVDELPKKKKKKKMSEEFDYLFTEQPNNKQYFAQDGEKRIVLGPAMVPDQKIFRKDNNGDPYYVYFSSETIKMIAEKYMRNKFIDNNDVNHDGTAVSDVYVIESWIKEDDDDKSNKYGFGDLPVGTWFVSMKVRDENTWQRIKMKELNGFSVSGYFAEVAQFTKEEMFLYKVAELLTNIKD